MMFTDFGNDHDGFEPTLTMAQWHRMAANEGHPPNWKPNHYAPLGAQGDTASTPNGMRATTLRASVA